MNEEIQKQLNKLTNTFASEQPMTVNQVKAIIKGLATVLIDGKQKAEKLNAKTINEVEALYRLIEKEHGKLSSNVNDVASKVKSEVASDMRAALDDVKAAVKKIEAMKPLDGVDADEDAIVARVWDKIEIPEPIEFKLEAEEVVDSINSLRTDSDNFKIDYTHIKNAPIIPNIDGMLAGGARFLDNLQDVSAAGATNGQGIFWNSTTSLWTAGDAGASSPLTTKGDIYTYSTVDARLPVGTNDYVLTADSTEATGLKWSANGTGDVTGPGSSTDNAITTFDSTTGKIIQNSTVTLDAGVITLPENGAIALDPAGSADGKFSGITFTATAGETFAFGDIVYLKAADSEWYLADASAVGTAGTVAIAIAVSSGADAGACTLMLSGIIRADAGFPTLTIGAPVYISETGTTTNTATVTAPATTDAVVKIVGYALTANEMLVQISPDHLTVT